MVTVAPALYPIDPVTERFPPVAVTVLAASATSVSVASPSEKSIV
jgi:hypothetical protein